MKKLTLTLILLFFSISAFSEPARVETNNFTFELPHGWKITELSSKAKISGPNNEFLILSASNITGEGNKSKLNSIKEKLGKKIENILKSGANDPALKITSPLKKEISKKGYAIWSIRTETKDGTIFFDQYGTIGIKAIVLITIEGKLKNKSSSNVVLNAVRKIKWQ
ncbi:hypothetical protein ACFL3P_01110 [Pseudomonadota bacterium]